MTKLCNDAISTGDMINVKSEVTVVGEFIRMGEKTAMACHRIFLEEQKPVRIASYLPKN
jgi:hypothetical protein